MNRPLLLILLACVIAANAHALAGGGHGLERRRIDAIPATDIEQELQRLAAHHVGPMTLWPGFDPLAIPLAVYDGDRTYLFRHPAPPEGFTVVEGTSGASVWPGRHEAVTANTNSSIGGVPTATLLVDRAQPEATVLELAANAIHEEFHVYQRARHPGWIGNEADLFAFPVDSAELLALRRLETEALRRALIAGEADGAECWARRALALRAERYKRMDPIFAAYERGTELNEGLATYVEMRAAGRRSVDLSKAEFGPAEVRLRAYATGPALAFLLDRVVPGWPDVFENNDRQTLDEALAAALGPGDDCQFDAADQIAAKKRATKDVAALAGERLRRLAAFESKPGSRVVVEAGGGEPLWPQGFDPLNIDRITSAQLLHTRFLRLGNAAGHLEVLGADALTDGVGTYPLFQGVRRITLTGLVKPEVHEADGKVRITTAGLTMEFQGASVTRDGVVTTVRLSP